MNVITFLILLFSFFVNIGNADAKDSFERISQKQEIRCGYVVWPGNLEIDSNTGRLSGISYDFMEAIGKELDYKIIWQEEVGWGTYAEGLNSGRYDMMCSPVWKSGQRAKISLLTRTLFYENMYGLAREDDNRFDKNLDAANKKSITFAVIDGDITQKIRKTLFPDAQELALSPISGSSPNMISVATKKADITMTNRKAMEDYNRNNDKKLKLIIEGQAIRQFPSAFAMRIGDHDLKALIDATIETLQTNGVAQKIIEKNKADLAPYLTNNQ